MRTFEIRATIRVREQEDGGFPLPAPLRAGLASAFVAKALNNVGIEAVTVEARELANQGGTGGGGW